MKIQRWTLYGKTGALLARGVHTFIGPDAAINTALAADVAIVLLLTIGGAA